MMRRRSHFQGFTLIELLIVVAIIAILAAIAVPNFLEAQTRAKISRCKSDMRTMAVATESYRVDFNKFPISTYDKTWGGDDLLLKYRTVLSTPVAFVTSVDQRDPFAPKDEQKWFTNMGQYDSYFMTEYGDSNGPAYSWGAMMRGTHGCVTAVDAMVIGSFGPDRVYGNIEYCIYDVDHNAWGAKPWPIKACGYSASIYDPTNGTISVGDIGRWIGSAPMTTTP